MILKQNYKNHFKLIGVISIIQLIILASFFYSFFFKISEFLNFWVFFVGPLLLLINFLSYIIYIRYLLFENDAIYYLENDKIEIHKNENITTITVLDIKEIVFNGADFIFEKFEPYRKLPWADFYFLEIGLKNGEWIAITNVVDKDILNVFTTKYPNLDYKLNRIFYPIMTMY